jgi:hypothetical protein
LESSTSLPEKTVERTQSNRINYTTYYKNGDYEGGTMSHKGTKDDSIRAAEHLKNRDKVRGTKTKW